ncbi:MAG: death domain-containing protein [Acidimicrobiales bacterium]
MERPPADPAKLLESWMEWERGEAPPGRVMSALKTGGLRDVLEALVAALAESDPVAVVDVPDSEAAESWTPIV